MFKFLKEKLSNAIKSFTKGVEQASEEIASPDDSKPATHEPKKVAQPKSAAQQPVTTKNIPEILVKKKIPVIPSVKKSSLSEKPPNKPVVFAEPEPSGSVLLNNVATPAEVTTMPEPFVVKKDPAPAPPEKKGFFSRMFGKSEEKQDSVGQQVKSDEKQGVISKITQVITAKKISSQQFDTLFWDLEVGLLENNVALEVIEKLRSDLRTALVDKPLPRSRVEESIAESLRTSVQSLFLPTFSLAERVRSKECKPFVIVFVGVNGSGKTTSIAKVAQYLINNGLSVVLAAGDTFRAAAIDQLQIHADALGVRLVKHDYGSDAAAVAFDAIKHAESQHRDVVLVDTAGRLHTNTNLMDEIKKVIRIAKPDLKVFVGEAITGNDCVEQAREFDAAIGIDGVVLAKADIDEKGGAAVSVSFVTKKPILFLGTGQEYGDLEEFSPEAVVQQLGIV